MIATHRLHVSQDRLETALSWLHAHTETLASITPDARRMAAIGLLICDDDGRFSQAELASALRDSRVISAANRLISEVGF